MELKPVRRLRKGVPAATQAAESEAQARLQLWTQTNPGMQAEICRKTGIPASFMSRMVNGFSIIGLEYAILIELATDGEFTAVELCPSRADTLFAYQKSIIAGMAK